MNVSNFANPVETVQIISIVSYLNTLSDFLYKKDFLDENDQYNKIPVVNGLYEYFDSNITERGKNKYLVYRLLQGSDLYGAEQTETVDVYFVNEMFNHIISTFVFEEYVNVYGFLAEVVRTSKNISIDILIHDIKRILQTLTFENGYGNDSMLTPLAVENIFTDLIEPLLPLPKKNPSILSIDYIYAQAGMMFLRSGQLNSRYLLGKANSTTTFFYPNTTFHECAAVGNLIEILVEAKVVDELALSVFSLPALLHYVHKDRDNLQNEQIRKIVTDPDHWAKAYRFLFSYLQSALKELHETLNNDYRYQLHFALANFKNRTILAREGIQKFCTNANENDIKEKVTKYVNNTNDFSCMKDDIQTFFPDLNQLYREEIEKLTDTYIRYERESIRQAFSQSQIDSINEAKVIILRGSFSHKGTRPSDDLLDFSFLGHQRSFWYALMRKDYNVTLIAEDTDPKLFYEKLGVSISERFLEQNFTNPLKGLDENFDQFSSKLAEQKGQRFKAQINSFDLGPKKRDWWEEFGLSFIPFYSCMTSSMKGNTFDEKIPCPMGEMNSFTAVENVENFTSKIITAKTRQLFHELGATVKKIVLRKSIRAVLNDEKKNVEKKEYELPKVFGHQMYHDLGHALIRLKHPGIELYFIIDIEGLVAIEEFIIKLKDKTNLKFLTLMRMLKKAKKMVTIQPKAIEKEFHKHPVFVKSVDDGKNSGYGYKFVSLGNGKIAGVRHIRESPDEVLVIYDRMIVDNNKKIYKEVDAETLEIKEHDLHVENNGLLVRFPEIFPSEIYVFIHNEGKCLNESDLPNSDILMFCARTDALVNDFESLTKARDYVLKFGKFEDYEIRHILKKFYFPPGGKTMMNFVSDWMATQNYSFPSWSDEYRIEEPKLFYDLRFQKWLDSTTITTEEAFERIKLLYSQSDLDRIDIPLPYMRNKYIEQKAYYSLRFEDYYAIGNQQGLLGSEGYLRLRENTDEARRMRNALYRLAIRQYYDTIEEFPQLLFSGEKQPRKVFEKQFLPKEDFSFGKFTAASRSIETAEDFTLSDQDKGMKVVYQIQFSERFLRAKVYKFHNTFEEEFILLPQTEFRIENVQKERNKKLGDYYKVVLTHKENSLKEVKDVLRQLKKLKDSDTMFYDDERPRQPLSKIQLCRSTSAC